MASRDALAVASTPPGVSSATSRAASRAPDRPFAYSERPVDGRCFHRSAEMAGMTRASYRTIAGDGGGCWFQDPRAVRHVGDRDRTYVGWITRSGDVQVGALDHRTNEVERGTLHADLEPDDHDAPTLFVDDDGHLLVFYSGHWGPDVLYRRSENPESLDGFGAEQAIAPSTGHTYPSPYALGEDLYLFYRDGNRRLSHVVSTDGGETWSDERPLVETGAWRGGGTVYFKIDSNGSDRIDIAVSHADSRTIPSYRDVRHVQFDGGDLRSPTGETVSPRDDLPARLDELPVVYDSNDRNWDTWVWDCATFGDRPAVAFVEFRDIDDHRYRYARWTGSEWVDSEITSGGSYITRGNRSKIYSGGVSLDGEEPGVCYVSVGDHGGSKLQRWETDDAGETWSFADLTDEALQNVRPVVPRGRHEDRPVLWMQGSYTGFQGDYDTRIVCPDPAHSG
jgi:hypothetical protein